MLERVKSSQSDQPRMKGRDIASPLDKAPPCHFSEAFRCSDFVARTWHCGRKALLNSNMAKVSELKVQIQTTGIQIHSETADAD